MTITKTTIQTSIFNNVSLLNVKNSFDNVNSNLLTNDMTDITQEALIDMLTNLNSISGMVSMFYYGDFSKSRTKNKMKVLKSLSYQKIFIGHNYQKKVNNRLIANAKAKGYDAPNFKTQKANGLTKISNLLFVNKDGQYRLRGYLGHDKQGQTENVSKSKTLGFFTQYDAPISKDIAIADNMFAPSYFAPKTYTSGRGQLVDKYNNFQVRNFSLENILAIAIGGKVYRVI